MTCPEARERLSALLDEALDLAERQAVRAHLDVCADCRRELEQLRATVALLERLPAARAPAGFVDQVMAATHRPPWGRRLLEALFVPLRVKLPLEAMAVLLVSVSALYVYQRTPEVRELARPEAREPSPRTPVAPPAPSVAPVPVPAAPETATPPAPASKDRAAQTGRPPVRPPAARDEPRPAPPVAASPPSAPPVAPGDRDVPAANLGAKLSAKKEMAAERREDALAPARSSTAPEQGAKAAEAPAAGPRATPLRPPSPPAVAPPAPQPRAGGTAGAVAPASPPVTPPSPRAPAEAPATAQAPVTRRLMRAVDASGRLTVAAREPAETALDTLLGSLGARRVERRLEGDRGLVVIDVLVPGARYRELIEGLRGIGRWVTDHEPGALPEQLRLQIALTVEP